MYDLKDFKAADHIPALLDWMRAQMKSCGGKTAVVGISGGKDSSVIAALCVEAYGRENVVGVLMPDGVQPDIDYSNGCAGCPTLDGTADVIRALERNGVSMIEIGIPFSDPMADGIVIQNAATRALHNGMSLRLLFEQLRDIRRDVRIPLVLMGYLNPIMQFGFEAFCQKCVECGIDGVIIPDLPFRDYEESYKAIASKYDIRVIMLITPETSEARVREIDAHTDGFIYLVSSAATTGAQKDFDTRKQAYFKKIEDMNLRNPRMVGFGISNKQTFDAACAHSSGAIIGSRFVTLLNEKEGDAEKAIRQLKEDLKQ